MSAASKVYKRTDPTALTRQHLLEKTSVRASAVTESDWKYTKANGDTRQRASRPSDCGSPALALPKLMESVTLPGVEKYSYLER